MNAMDNTVILSIEEYDDMEEKVDKLEAQLLEANKVIGFYGGLNWCKSTVDLNNCDRFTGLATVMVKKDISQEIDSSDLYVGHDGWSVGGKRARSFLAKYPEEKK